MFEDISFDHFYSELKKVLESTFTNTDFIPKVRIEHEFNAQSIIELYQDILYGKQECRGPIIILHHEGKEHPRPVIIMPALNGGLPTVFFPWMTIENSRLAELVDEFMASFDEKFSLLKPLFIRALHVSCHSPHPETFPSEIVKKDEHFCLYQLVYLFRQEEILEKTTHSPLPHYDELLSAFELFNFSLSRKKTSPTIHSLFSSPGGGSHKSVVIQGNDSTFHRSVRKDDLESLKTLSFDMLTAHLLKNKSPLSQYAILLGQYIQTPSLENLHRIQEEKPNPRTINKNEQIFVLLMTRFLESFQELTKLNFLCDFPVPLSCFDFHFGLIAAFAERWKTFFNQENYFSFLPLLFSLFSGDILPRSLYLLSLVCADAKEAWPTSVNISTLMTPDLPPAHQEMWVKLLKAMLFQDPILTPPASFLTSLFHDQLDFAISLDLLPNEERFHSLREIILNTQIHSSDNFVLMVERIFFEYEMAAGSDKGKLNAIKTFLISDKILPIPDLGFIRSNIAAQHCVRKWLDKLDTMGLEQIEQKCKELDAHLRHIIPEIYEPNLDQDQNGFGLADLEKVLSLGRYNFQQALVRFIHQLSVSQLKLEGRIMKGDYTLIDQYEHLADLLFVCTQEDLTEPCLTPKREVIRQQLCQIKENHEDREFELIKEDSPLSAPRNSPVLFFNKNLPELSNKEIFDNLTECYLAYESLVERRFIEKDETFFYLLNFSTGLSLSPKHKRDFYNKYCEKIEEILAVKLSLESNCT